jgi:hypothetical protein
MNGNKEDQKIDLEVTKQPDEVPQSAPNHWQLIRDLVVFQAKLALDGLRDLVLLPISLLAAILGLVASPDNPGKYFQRLLEFGRQTDVWINLFGATHHYQQDDAPPPSSDAYVEKLEEMLINEYKRGGVVKNLKDHTDNLVRRVQAEVRQESRQDDSV